MLARNELRNIVYYQTVFPNTMFGSLEGEQNRGEGGEERGGE